MQAWRIYCGGRRGNGRRIQRRQVERFLRGVVRPHFEAFTVHQASGFWGRSSEPSMVIEVLTAASDAAERIGAVANEYKRRFAQEAVLVVRSNVRSTLV